MPFYIIVMDSYSRAKVEVVPINNIVLVVSNLLSKLRVLSLQKELVQSSGSLHR